MKEIRVRALWFAIGVAVGVLAVVSMQHWPIVGA